MGSGVHEHRSANEIEDLAGALLAYSRSNPGQRGEQIAAALKTDTDTMRPPYRPWLAAIGEMVRGEEGTPAPGRHDLDSL